MLRHVSNRDSCSASYEYASTRCTLPSYKSFYVLFVVRQICLAMRDIHVQARMVETLRSIRHSHTKLWTQTDEEREYCTAAIMKSPQKPRK